MPGEPPVFDGFALGFVISRSPMLCRLYKIYHMMTRITCCSSGDTSSLHTPLMMSVSSDLCSSVMSTRVVDMAALLSMPWWRACTLHQMPGGGGILNNGGVMDFNAGSNFEVNFVFLEEGAGGALFNGNGGKVT